MLFLLSLAFRNLTRNFRRTVITSVAVVCGVALQILGWGMVDGLDENVLRAAANTSTGDILLRPDGYPEDNLSWPLAEAEVITPELQASLAQVGDVAPRLMFSGRMIAGAESSRILGIAFDREADPKVFPRENWQVEGGWPAKGESGVVIGQSLARLLSVQVGGTVMVEARTVAGAINALSYPVTGIIRTDNSLMDGIGLWLDMEQADELVLTEGKRTHIAIKVKSGAPEDHVSALESKGWSVNTVRDECADLLSFNVIRRRAIMFMVFIIMAIAGTGIANTVVMAAYERVREIGTLMALGMSKSSVRALFLLEGAAIGIAAGTVGTLLGVGAVFYFQINGINLGDMLSRVAADVPMSTMLFTKFNLAPTLASFAFGVVVAILASLQPARYAASLVPADAIRAD